MKKMFNKKIIAIAAGLFASQFAFSQTAAINPESVTTNSVTTGSISAQGNITIRGNSDGTIHTPSEGVFISSNGPSANLLDNRAYIDLKSNGVARIAAQAGASEKYVEITGTGVLIEGNTEIRGTATITNGAVITNNTSINVTGNATTSIGNALSTNTIIGATSINGSGTRETNIGTGGGATNIGTAASANTVLGTTSITGTTTINGSGNFDTTIGNASASTKVTATAGKAQMLLSNTGGTTVDANGKILTNGATGYVNPAAPTAAVTLTNSLGNTHGLVVTESQTTLSGGTQSSSMTLNDRGATFSNAQNGAPITVTGVANGRADFDAVNVRQFAGAIAAVAAQANIPALAAGQDRTFGVGLGNFMGKSALAMGLSMRGGNNAVYKATVSSGLNNGMNQTVVGLGGAWGF